MVKYQFFNDPSHGWLEVPLADLQAAGLSLNDISIYSYLNTTGTTLYLEEDHDAPIFIQAKAKMEGISMGGFIHDRVTEVHLDPCFVRDLPRIR